MRSARHLVGILAGWICCSGAGAATPQTGRFVEVQTEHFVVRAPRGAANDVQQWGERCEALKRELGAKWFAGSGSNRAGKERGSELDTEVGSGEAHDRDVAANRNRSIDRRDAAGRDGSDLEGRVAKVDEVAWSPRCLVVVHGDALSYLRAVPGGERTVASAWVEIKRGTVVTRQIDVRGDRADWLDGALAHEIVHILAADRFIAAPMPRWADEGLALLADPSDKQARHHFDFLQARMSGGTFRMGELLNLHEYPAAARMTTYYGQSASLVRYLTARGRPRDFVDFVERAVERGYDEALREVYGIDGVVALESEWLRSLETDRLATAE